MISLFMSLNSHNFKKNAFASGTLSRTYGTGSLLTAFLCLCFSVLYPPENSDLCNKGNMQN